MSFGFDFIGQMFEYNFFFNARTCKQRKKLKRDNVKCVPLMEIRLQEFDFPLQQMNSFKTIIFVS